MLSCSSLRRSDNLYSQAPSKTADKQQATKKVFDLAEVQIQINE